MRDDLTTVMLWCLYVAACQVRHRRGGSVIPLRYVGALAAELAARGCPP